MLETRFLSWGWENSLAKGKATHSTILAWRIPWTIKSMGSQRVGHDWITFTFTSLQVPSMPTFWSVFIINVEFCRKLFLHLLRLSHDFYPSVCWCGVSHWLICVCWRIFAYLGWFPLDHDIWSFLVCCWILFARILLRIFASIFISDIGCRFIFWWYLCLVFISGWWWPYRMSLGVFLPLQFSRRVWAG